MSLASFLRLDDNCLSNIARFLGPNAHRNITMLVCTSQSLRQSLDARDNLWGDLLATLGSGERDPRSKRQPQRQSKRLKCSGKDRFVHALAARRDRSVMLIVKVTADLERRQLTAAHLKKYIRELEPVDLNAVDQSGFTVLNLVTSFGHFRDQRRVLVELLKRGADPNVGDADGMTPLMNSAACGDVEKLKLLLEHGADKGLKQRGAHSEGWRALAGEDRELFKESVASRRFQGTFTAQEWAVNYEQSACVQALVEAADRLVQGST